MASIWKEKSPYVAMGTGAAMALLFAAVISEPVQSSGVQAPKTPDSYTVARGDTLSRLANRACPKASLNWMRSYIQAAVKKNNLGNPNAIEVGTKLFLPTMQCPPVQAFKKDVFPEESASSSASQGKRFTKPLPPEKKPKLELDLSLIERSTAPSCALAGNPKHGWKKLTLARASCIRSHYGTVIDEAARLPGLSANLITAVMIVESKGNPNAISSSRCLGLMQLEPPTAKDYGVDLQKIFDPRENILGGARVLSAYRMQYWGGDLNRGLASYNIGPSAVERRMREEAFDPASFDYTLKVKQILAVLENQAHSP